MNKTQFEWTETDKNIIVERNLGIVKFNNNDNDDVWHLILKTIIKKATAGHNTSKSNSNSNHDDQGIMSAAVICADSTVLQCNHHKLITHLPLFMHKQSQ